MTRLSAQPLEPAAQDAAIQSNVVLVTGMSGGGKSEAMHALEDAGFFCVDNLPADLLLDFLRLEQQRGERRVAIAVDVRSAGSLPLLLPLFKQLRADGVAIRSIFFDANTETLMRRFSETRRPHPLRQEQNATSKDEGHRALLEAITLERELLAALRAESTVLDSSQLRPAQLRAWVRDLVVVDGNSLTLVFESFAFKHGVPSDADFVFDVRVLPNPYYERELRPLNGRDQPVADYLAAQPEVNLMLSQIGAFMAQWLPNFAADQRSYLTVAIGCTGGQHRSVYLVETLAQQFAHHGQVLKRHRELDAK
ncbi:MULTISPECIES: RNase adapter RapZ [Roseateles]|uniref:RNase adapter RapZ n=1 Tax=Roseateles albus TaxID=2987525 RepID=A0ABT5KCR1_9BURK|nr:MULTISPECIES: RNase adapter RapZ [Roseateles]MCV2359621.1 RNase adapter RapZ [Paucibacter sp. TC2R-5]MDC8771708.1 RNase adapter RapZ [Roseateles albus]